MVVLLSTQRPMEGSMVWYNNTLVAGVNISCAEQQLSTHCWFARRECTIKFVIGYVTLGLLGRESILSIQLIGL